MPTNELSAASWLNTPAEWNIDTNGSLRACSGNRTDFWRETYYDFVRDDGHALLCTWDSEFTAAVTIAGDYEMLYDQAGLMVRSGPDAWVKFGIELTDNVTHLSSVVTHNRSDWSARPAPEASKCPITVRISRIGDALLLQSLNSEGHWRMERLAPWPVTPETVSVGPYLCSPQRTGFVAHFSDFQLTAPLQRELHI